MIVGACVLALWFVMIPQYNRPFSQVQPGMVEMLRDAVMITLDYGSLLLAMLVSGVILVVTGFIAAVVTVAGRPPTEDDAAPVT